MTRFHLAALAAVSSVALAACTSSGPVDDGIAGQTAETRADSAKPSAEGASRDTAVVTGSLIAPPAPPPPPALYAPPPPVGMASQRMATVAPYPQIAPQPMPGEVNRDNYEDVEINAVKVEIGRASCRERV